MRKLIIRGIAYLCKPLSYEQPNQKAGGALIIAYPEHDHSAEPLFLVDNNGLNPFAEYSYAVWMPAQHVKFVDPDDRQTSWETNYEKSHRLAIEELKRFTEYVAARSEGNRVLGAGELEAVRISNARIRQILESWI